MNRTALPAVLRWVSATVLILAAHGSPRGAAAEFPALCPGCNVLLISLDTLRADALGVLGSPRSATPTLDALARRGVLFTNAYSQAPNTFPSHMSLFTGLYPWHHGVNVVKRDKLPTDIPTAAMLFKRGGYRTFWFAPMNDNHLDLNVGFEKGFDRLQHHGGPGFQEAIKWLGGHPAGPFFAFLHSYRVHLPYTPKVSSVLKIEPASDPKSVFDGEAFTRSLHEEILANPALIFSDDFIAKHPDIFASGTPRWEEFEFQMKDQKHVRTDYYNLSLMRFNQRLPPGAPGAGERLRVLYDAVALELDEAVAALIGSLEDAGLTEKTVVVLTSDHGEEFLEHGRQGHNQLYSECLHVPMIVLVPGIPERRVEQIVRNIDVLPTLLEAVGLPAPDGIDGESLVPALRGHPLPQPRRALAFWRNSFSVRDERFTYIAAPMPGGKPPAEELYDRAADPREERNLFPARALEAKSWRSWLPRKSTAPPQGVWPESIDEQTRRRIMKTGYW